MYKDFLAKGLECDEYFANLGGRLRKMHFKELGIRGFVVISLGALVYGLGPLPKWMIFCLHIYYTALDLFMHEIAI